MIDGVSVNQLACTGMAFPCRVLDYVHFYSYLVLVHLQVLEDADATYVTRVASGHPETRIHTSQEARADTLTQLLWSCTAQQPRAGPIRTRALDKAPHAQLT